MENHNRVEQKKVIVGLGKTGLSCAKYLASRGENFMVVDSRSRPPGLDQFRVEFPDVEYELGEFSDSTFRNARELIVSPGISLSIEPIANARAAGVPVTGDIDIFSKAVTAPVIAVTGSNGKSTVVSLLAEIFRKAEISFGLGGNLDGDNFKPALDLLSEPAKDFYILELSSFQLETTQQLNAEIAVILNLSEDHMDRYDDLAAYLKAKQRIFVGCKHIAVNIDNVYSAPPSTVKSTQWQFSIVKPTENGFYLQADGDAENLVFNGKSVLRVDELKIVGQHNLSNALAAMTIAKAAGVDLDKICDGLRSFTGLPHRCQWVGEVNGVAFYNDSKGTNVGATVAAVEGLGRKLAGGIQLIAGGIGKGADFSPLAQVLRQWVKQVILIGKDAPQIAAVLHPQTHKCFATSMEEAVERAFSAAVPGDAVLLSPACASFDMFNDFGHRGQVFIDAVRRLQCQPSQ